MRPEASLAHRRRRFARAELRARARDPRGQWSTAILIVAQALTLREAVSWSIFGWISGGPSPTPAPLDEALAFNITISKHERVGQEWLDGIASLSSQDEMDEGRSGATPETWNSSQCMAMQGSSELQREVDPGGYLVFADCREQLGNNRILLSDGMVIAKALDRTLVEFPVANSRIASPDAKMGLCTYWDCNHLCDRGCGAAALHLSACALKEEGSATSIYETRAWYHRILDLRTFRAMLHDGRIDTHDFVELESGPWEQRLLPSLETPENITDFFGELGDAKVIVMKMAWKSGLLREPLQYLRPNPFYNDKVHDLISAQQGWEGNNFLAVQWRTETSWGNLTRCYEQHVRPAVEEHRRLLGLEAHQVFVNVDLFGQTSTTYNSSVVQANQRVVELVEADYPSALDNAVYDSLRNEDAGIRAFVCGLVSASSRRLLSSSFKASGSGECQKPHSKYIDLVADWRTGIYNRTDPDSIVRLFPSSEGDVGDRFPAVGACLVACGIACLVLVVVAARKGPVMADVFGARLSSSAGAKRFAERLRTKDHAL